MVGHATLLIQAAGLNILTDPVWSDRASPVSFAGPKRVNAPGIAFSDLPPVDIVLLTHNHYDHLDLDTLARLHQAHAPLVITPLGNDAIVRPAIPGMKIMAGDWGDRVQAGAASIHFEPCHHWSARGMTDRRMALWAAFVIETPAGRIYHVGDTGFHDGRNYRAAAGKHGGFRLAILPFGAYEPRWFMKGQHQNPSEAVEGFRLANAQWAAGHHWGTFQLTDEAIEEPRESELFTIIHDVMGEAEPGVPVVPYLLPGFTDAKAFTQLGARWYGFAPVKLPAGMRFADMFHGHNERIPVDGLAWGTNVLGEVVERIAR